MKKLYCNDKYLLTLYNVNTTVLYGNEKTKDCIINELKKSFVVIDSSINGYSTLKEMLVINNFDMSYVPKFNLSKFLTCDYNNLPFSKKLFFKILVHITSKISSIYVFDDVLTLLDYDDYKTITGFLKENKIIYINFSSNTEETIFTDYLIILTSKVMIEGETTKVLYEEKLIKRLGFDLPFSFDLSKQLIEYQLLDSIIKNDEELVDKLWN